MKKKERKGPTKKRKKEKRKEEIRKIKKKDEKIISWQKGHRKSMHGVTHLDFNKVYIA